MKKRRTNKQNTSKNYFLHNLNFILPFILGISVLVIYIPTGSFDFVNIDDNSLIYENPTVIDKSISFQECFQRMKGGVHYKPLVFLSWKLEYNLLGESPSHFHIINWIFHLLNTLILFQVLKIVFQKLYSDKNKILIASFLVALLFTINPLRVESVAWATERKDVMFGFFFLLGYLYYLKFIEKKKYIFLLLGAVFYLLSGLSKSMGVTLFAVLFLTDFWYNRRLSFKLFFEKIPFALVLFVLLNLYGTMEFGSSNVAALVSETEEVENSMEIITSAEHLENLSPELQWFFTTSARFMLWIGHSIIPIKISVHYPHNVISNSLGKSIYLFPFLVLGLFFLFWRYRHRNKAVLAGMLFFAITLSPALLVTTSGQGIFLSDRYTYIPSIGIFFAIVAFLYNGQFSQWKKMITGFLILFFFVQSVKAVQYWENSGSLFKQVLKVHPNSGFGHLNLGKFYYDQKNIVEAANVYTRGIARAPGYYKLYSNRGKIMFDQGQFEQAIQDFDKCLSLKPDYVTALANRGAAYGAMEDFDKALIDLNKALEINPRDLNALSNRGLLFMFTRDYNKAVVDYENYLKINPNDDAIWNSLGLSYYNLNEYNKAISNYDVAIRLDDSKGPYYYNRSIALSRLDENERAYADAIKARTLGVKISERFFNSLKN
ncbi:tetratricopeptide repeat protein [Maribellus mangrovi]|uniref:tetratricopeptide repeat protein n=1 Tax=Maribellus mangrovi TaxID=3133146 RepID=UPI0030EE9B0A